jgi:fatty-acyl-CoA synthase
LPKDFTTLIEMLAFRAEFSAKKVAFTFEEKSVSFAELWQDINLFGSFLLARGLKRGERVLVALPNSAEFFLAFYGIQRAGGIAVPLFPEAGVARIFSFAKLCDAKTIIAPSNLPEKELICFRQLAEKKNISIISVKDSEKSIFNEKFPEIKPDDISFLQYTSGSTGNPKGVMLTHANLLMNIRQMIAGMEITANEIFVSWLPVYHDMGLILKTMVPFYLAAESHLLPTSLRNIHPWLAAIQKYKATFTAAPDFAYRLSLRHAAPHKYDLSTLRVALNAAEPVRAKTITNFEKAFGLKNVMVAGYGLAEATVGVSMWKPGTPNRVDSRGQVSVGALFPDVDLLIVSDQKIQSPNEVGEIAIRSKANSQGYFNNLDENAKLFWKNGYFLSGDLGYIDEDGYLYIVGRKKNIIKRAGVTISPREIEEVVDAISHIRFSAAIGVDKGGIEGEQVFVFAEIRDGEMMSEDNLHEIAVEMTSSFYNHMGFRPARVYLLKAHSIPLTHNGKIQHLLLKENYLNRNLREENLILYPEY